MSLESWGEPHLGIQCEDPEPGQPSGRIPRRLSQDTHRVVRRRPRRNGQQELPPQHVGGRGAPEPRCRPVGTVPRKAALTARAAASLSQALRGWLQLVLQGPACRLSEVPRGSCKQGSRAWPRMMAGPRCSLPQHRMSCLDARPEVTAQAYRPVLSTLSWRPADVRWLRGHAEPPTPSTSRSPTFCSRGPVHLQP